MLARLAPIAILLAAACSDDAGWSRDELPANARVALAVTATSSEACAASWLADTGFTGVGAVDLGTDVPKVYVRSHYDTCGWSGDAVVCDLTPDPIAHFVLDFGASTARMEVPYDPPCSIDYAVTSVTAIP